MTKPAKLAAGVGVAALGCAAAAVASSGLRSFLWGWAALSCFVVAGAYAFNLPQVFGKRAGRIAAPNLLMLLPYLSAFWTACWWMRWLRRGSAPWNEVAADVYVGGRLRSTDLPAGVALVVDLTCEFNEPRELRKHPGYRGFPVLDGHFPANEDAFAALIREVAASEGGVLFHCEAGRGRAPTAAAIALIARALVADPRAALERVAKGRPQSAPARSDLDFIDRMAPRVRPRAT